MSKGVNKVILIGNLGQAPETKYMPNGAAVTNVTLATSESWKDKNTGEQKERTEWHRVVFFRKLAEIAGNYLRKGSKVYVEGKLQTRKWQDKSGQDRYTTEIIADELEMLDQRQGGRNDSNDAQDTRNRNRQSENFQAPHHNTAKDFDDFDDSSIPF